MNYTEKQKKAIENRGNILVSAAAGSGKTRVLTQKICRIIQSKEADVDALLVLTFTDSAAAEMKKRIYETLMSISTESEKLGIMAEKVVQANISTIHSFCQRVIREKYYVLGLSPSFNIASEKDNTRLLKKTLSEILEEQSEAENPDIARLYLRYGKRNGKFLNEMIISLYHALMVMPEPEIFKTTVHKNYLSAEYQDTIKTIIKNENLHLLNQAKEILENLLKYARIGQYTKAETILDGYLDLAQQVYQLFASGDYARAKEINVFKTTFSIDKMPDDIKAVFTTGKANALKLIKTVTDNPLLGEMDALLNTELATVTADASALLELALNLGQRFSEAKLKKNTLDFNDLEHYAYTILKDPGQAKDFRYKYIFIDEYQDTNPLQEAILEKVKGTHNLFMVGDVKQSIYGFRHADSDIFLSKQNRYIEFDKKPYDDDELIRMNENFRSSNTVISAVNYLMGELLTEDFGEIDYKNKEALVHGSALTEGKAELLLVDCNADFYAPEKNGDALTAIEAEAFAIANQMMSIKGQTFFSRESGAEKPFDFSDMVVLLRELKNSGPIYKRVFESCGIPVDISVSSGSANLPEVEQFASILRCTLNPTDDIALVSAMRYVYFGISTDDIAKIKIFSSDQYGSFYQSVQNYLSKTQDALTEKLTRFFDVLSHLKNKSLLLSGEAFLNYVYHYLQFEEILAASPRKSLKAEALKGYIRALVAETSGSAHLARIVSLLDEMKQNEETLDAVSTHKNPNSARIMTIHNSKGLEFPVVFIAGLEKKFHKDNTSDFVIDKDLGLGFKIIEPKKSYKRDGIIYQSISKKQQRLALFEEVRVLYVAMTRAENQLYLVGGINNLRNSLCRWLTYDKNARFFANHYIDLIAPIVLNKQAFAEGFAIERFLPPDLSITSALPIRILPKSGYAYAKGLDRQSVLDEFLHQTPADIQLGYTYPYAERLGIPSKRSVSSLKPAQHLPAPRKQVTFTTLDASALTAAERGTAFHVYMQHANFNHENIGDIKKHIISLVQEQTLTEDEAAALSPEKILSVLQSDIISRAKKSPLCYREKNFSMKMRSEDLGFSPNEWVVVQGTIDLCFLEEDTFVLVDYKTDRVTKDTLQGKIKDYQKQVDIYAQALTLLTGYRVKEKFLYFLNDTCTQV